jgi:imidazolonepropionase
MNRVLIRGARQLLTLRGSAGPRRGLALGNLGIIEDGAVLVEDGRIREAGTTRRVENLEIARRAQVIEATGCVILPGFIDCHTDLITAAGPFIAEPPSDAPGARMMLPMIKVLRDLSAVRMKAAMLESLIGCATQGTTTLQAGSGFGLTERAELRTLRVLGSMVEAPVETIAGFYGAHMVPDEFECNSGAYMDWLCSVLLPIVARRSLARFAHASCDCGSFGETDVRKYLECAAALGLATRVHFAQFARVAPIQFALEAKAASVDHLEFASTADLEAIADSETMAVLLPAVSFYLGRERYADARTLIDTGAAVALGTGYNRMTAPGSNMQFAVFLAFQKLKMSVAEAITAATINAAHVLRIANRAGSIEPGKYADLIMLNTPDYRALACEFGVNLVSMTMKRGNVVYSSADGT